MRARAGAASARENWLGTDDQAAACSRGVIYKLRLPDLFQSSPLNLPPLLGICVRRVAYGG